MSQPAARCCATPQSHDGTDADDASDESSGAESDGDGDMFDAWHSELERRSVRAVLGVDESRAPDDMQALLRVSMRARVGWPLSIVVARSHTAVLSRVFAFVLCMKRARHALNDLFLTMPRDARKHEQLDGNVVHRLQLLRARMLQFADATQRHVLQSLQREWTRFQRLHSDDVESLRVHWADFVERIEQRCWLDADHLRTFDAVVDILQLALRLRTRCALLHASTSLFAAMQQQVIEDATSLEKSFATQRDEFLRMLHEDERQEFLR